MTGPSLQRKSWSDARAPALGVRWSAAVRRDVRRKVALARECGCHSVRVHGAVWTLRHEQQLPTRLPQDQSQGSSPGRKPGQSKRQQRSTERAAAHRARCAAVDAFRVRCSFCHWKHRWQHAAAAANSAAALLLPPPEKRKQPSSPPSPLHD